ncbi:hypothetical protein [Catellatospora vulcania]|uniref:hypothetical protein n=1 Tax=Catellatospora vulcania TaxID=1460450 RepID=UPI0012D3A24B|nr:hypothetical protein [Catellatospora vulcania]
MTEDEYAELLQYTRGVVMESRRGDLDELLTGAARRIEMPTARRQLLRYLHGLRDEMRLGSDETARRTMRRLAHVRTESGGAVNGIVLDVMPADQSVYGAATIDLMGSPELDTAVQELDELIAMLGEGEEPWG